MSGQGGRVLEAKRRDNGSRSVREVGDWVEAGERGRVLAGARPSRRRAQDRMFQTDRTDRTDRKSLESDSLPQKNTQKSTARRSRNQRRLPIAAPLNRKDSFAPAGLGPILATNLALKRWAVGFRLWRDLLLLTFAQERFGNPLPPNLPTCCDRGPVAARLHERSNQWAALTRRGWGGAIAPRAVGRAGWWLRGWVLCFRSLAHCAVGAEFGREGNGLTLD